MLRLLPVLLLALPACRGGDDDEATCVEDYTSCEAGVCLDGACVEVVCDEGDCASSQYLPVADTRVTACYDADGEIPCPGTPGDPDCATTPGCGQDAQLAGPTSRFHVEGADDEAVVEDITTGLTWQGCVVGQGPGCTGDGTLLTWFEAVNACEALEWGGHDDWELPDIVALQSITDFSTTAPAIDATAFPNTPHRHPEDDTAWWSDCTWSSTLQHANSDVAWASMVNSGDVLLGSGVPYHPHDTSAEGWDGCWARCARGFPASRTGRWLRRGTPEEPVHVDVLAERAWPACAIGQTAPDCAGEASQLTWTEALAACEALEWGGYDDWRLPDILELRSLVDLDASRPAIDAARFPNTPIYDGVDNLRGQFWSSTARWYNGFALYTSFNDGGSHFYVQSEGRHVRCVR